MGKLLISLLALCIFVDSVRADACLQECGLQCSSLQDCTTDYYSCYCTLNGAGIAIVLIFGVFLPIFVCTGIWWWYRRRRMAQMRNVNVVTVTTRPVMGQAVMGQPAYGQPMTGGGGGGVG